MSIRPVLALAALALAACSDTVESAATDPAALRGEWGSALSSQFVLLSLEPSAGTVRGSAEVETSTTYAVRGTYRAPGLHLALSGPARMDLEATVRGDTLDGVWSGGPYDGRRIVLVRQ